MRKALTVSLAVVVVVLMVSGTALAAAPIIQNVTNAIGGATLYQGGLANITGTNFGYPGLTQIPGQPVKAGYSVSFGGVQANNYYFWQGSLIQVEVPATVTPGTVACTVTTEEGSNSKSVTVAQNPIGNAPQVTGVDPAGGYIGDLVTVSGANFGATRIPATSNVYFGATAATVYKSWSDTRIEAYIPQGITAQVTTLTVATAQGVSAPVTFVVYDASQPSIYVDITTPADGTFLDSSVAIAATVYSYEAIDRVEFYADGVLISTDTAAPYTATWDCSGAEVGTHTVQVTAHDAVGAERTNQISLFKNPVIPAPSDTWYLPEGCTDFGFETWVLIQNPGSEEVGIEATYMMPGGETQTGQYAVGGQRRLTINLNEILPATDVSTKLTATGDIIAERAMYWDGRNGGHASIGLTSMNPTWYLAEGCTGFGFDEWILLMNPGDSDTTARITYMLEGGGTSSAEYALPAHSRTTVEVSKDCPGANVSAMVESLEGQDIAVERAMYWDDMTGGHCTIGSRASSTEWYIAEGATHSDYDTWVLVANPGDKEANVTATFMGQGGALGAKDYAMKPHSRLTVHVNEEVAAGQDVSTKIEADRPVISERAVYYMGRLAGHGSIGTPTPSPTWYLAEGCTGFGFTTWVLIQNSDPTLAAAPTVTFMTEGSDPVTTTVAVAAQGRASVNVGDYVPDASVSIQVQAAQNVDLVVERAMYWQGPRIPGASGSVGVRAK